MPYLALRLAIWLFMELWKERQLGIVLTTLPSSVFSLIKNNMTTNSTTLHPPQCDILFFWKEGGLHYFQPDISLEIRNKTNCTRRTVIVSEPADQTLPRSYPSLSLSGGPRNSLLY